MTKKCTICRESKPLSGFNKKSSRKDGLQSMCRECSNARGRAHYKKNRAKYKRKARKRNNRVRDENKRRIFEYLAEHGCTDCGITDIRVLEFDHVTGDKLANVSELSNTAYKWGTILAEIEKCEVVCANCHRIRHYERGDWKKADKIGKEVVRSLGDVEDSTGGCDAAVVKSGQAKT